MTIDHHTLWELSQQAKRDRQLCLCADCLTARPNRRKVLLKLRADLLVGLTHVRPSRD